MDLASDGNAGPVTARYGAWPSPIGASDVAVAGIRLSGPVPVHTDAGDEVWWAEARPAEGGRTVVVRRDAAGTVVDVLPAAVERPHPGARVRRRPRGCRCPAAGWCSRTGPTSGSTGSTRLDARRCRSPRSRPSRPACGTPTRCSARAATRSGGCARRTTRRHDPRGTSSRCRWTARPPPTRPRCGRSPAAATSSPSPRPSPGRPAAGLDRLGPPADAVGRHRAAGRRRSARTAR